MPHQFNSAPLTWVSRFEPLVSSRARVLDLACGGGRHSRLFADQANRSIIAVDIDTSQFQDPPANVELLQIDLESGDGESGDGEGGKRWLAQQQFDCIIVTNYLHRPLMPAIFNAIAPDGLLIYQTFAQGNEQYGKPSNPDFLLAPGELLAAVDQRFRVLAYEDLTVVKPSKACVQAICARRLLT
jgi:SAM-dependent methyltransferase